jgi:hypothetical protein
MKDDDRETKVRRSVSSDLEPEHPSMGDVPSPVSHSVVLLGLVYVLSSLREQHRRWNISHAQVSRLCESISLSYSVSQSR